MTQHPPNDPDSSETASGSRHGDEIAITDVPDDVARELEELFGGPGSQQEDATVIILDDLRDEGHQSVTIDVSQQSVVQIGSDADDLLVIDAEDIDRIVIVDNDQPDPTFEERRRKRERREKLKKIRWVKWTLIGLGALVVVIGLLASPLFSIRDVEVEGVVYTSSEAIAAATDLIDGESFFTLDTAAAQRILEDDPWVADVRISKHFPDSVVIEISERVPVVWYVGEDNKARIVDAEGVVIAVLDGWPTEYLQVRGVGPSLQGGAIADVGYRAAAQTVLALPDELSRLVESLELGAGGELSMTLTSGTIVRFGTPTDLQNKLVSVVVLLRRQNPTNIAVIDVSTGEVTVAMR